jgi:signal transduction histidine kinase/CheY-like chemotaxis protein
MSIWSNHIVVRCAALVERRRVLPYFFAILFTLLAFEARTLLSPAFGLGLPFITFYLSISTSAWLGGFGPGVLSTLLSAGTAAYFWLPPAGFGVSSTADIIGLGEFLFIGILVSVLFERLRRARVQAETKAQGERELAVQQAVVAELGQQALARERLPELMNDAVRLVSRTLHTVFCEVLELRPDQNAFVLRAGVGWREGLTGTALVSSGADSHAGYALLTGHPVIVDDLRAERRFNSPPLLVEHGIISGMNVIIHGSERPYGILGTHTKSHRIFTKDAVQFLQAMADVLASAIERQHAAEEQKRLFREAHEANRLKDEFLATLSHELRTPLTAILGWARILQGRPLDANTNHALEIIARNAVAQTHLIEDLLDVSRIITGKLRLEVQTVDLSRVVDAAVEAIRPAATAKQIRLEISADPSTPSVRGDPHRLQQVIWNLLSNAVKFSRTKGSVEVTVGCVRSAVQIAVRDTGVGVRRELLPFVFDRFRQADSSSTRAHSGLGLGLAIVRHLVELHGGTVHAESAGEGQGATFTATFPIQALAIPGRHPEQLLQPNGRDWLHLEGVRVLVVDDEEEARDLVANILETYGMSVTSASSVAEALDVIGRVKPDVLVADIGMPDADGYALISAVRALGVEQGGRVPAVALTAYARTEDRQRTQAAGFQAHVVKPVEPWELANVIAELCHPQTISAG